MSPAKTSVKWVRDGHSILVGHIQCPSQRFDDAPKGSDISNRLSIGFSIHLGALEMLLPQLLALFGIVEHVP